MVVRPGARVKAGVCLRLCTMPSGRLEAVDVLLGGDGPRKIEPALRILAAYLEQLLAGNEQTGLHLQALNQNMNIPLDARTGLTIQATNAPRFAMALPCLINHLLLNITLKALAHFA